MELAERGLYIFPADHPELPQCAGPRSEQHPDPATCDQRGKHPAIKWDTGASTSPDNIHFWWAGSPRNVGIHCGKSGLLVVDEDAPGEFAKFAAALGQTIPETYTVTTAKGKHYYFRDTQDGKLGIREGAFRDYDINIRSGNGYVIGPGSVHVTGVVYTENGVRTYADVPGWVVDAIKGEKHGNGSDPGSGFDAFELPEVIKEHHRDTELFRFASSLRSQTLNHRTAKLLMQEAFKRCEQPPVAKTKFTWDEALAKLDGVYDRYPPGRSDEYQKNGENGPASVGRHLEVTSAADMVMKATRWIWEHNRDHWIPIGEITGLAGREGVGKSTWSAHLSAQTTRGELPGDFWGKPKGVVIVTTEDDWSATVQPRLVAAGADLTKVFHTRAIQADGLEDTVSLPSDLAEFERVIREYDVALVILDPLLTLINKKLDTHKDAEIRQALDPLVRVAHNTRASFVGLIHVNKSNDGDLMNRIMGSRAIGAVCRAVLFCGSYKPVEEMAEEDPDVFKFASPELKRARFVFGQIKNNLQAKVMKSIEYHMAGQKVGYDEEAQKDIEGSHMVPDRELPENVEDVYVGRQAPGLYKSRYANPYPVRTYGLTESLRLYCLHAETFNLPTLRRDLAGKDLACWCPLDQPCHGDVLLELANSLRVSTC